MLEPTTCFFHPLFKSPLTDVEVEPKTERYALGCTESGVHFVFDCLTSLPTSLQRLPKRSALSAASWMKYDIGIYALGSLDGLVWLFDSNNPQNPLGKPIECNSEVYTLSFAPKTSMLAAALGDGAVQLIDIRMDHHLHVLKTKHGDDVVSAEFSPISDFLCATGDAGGHLELFDIRQPKEPFEMSWFRFRMEDDVESCGEPPLVAVKFARDGSVLSSYGIDGALRIWNPDTGLATGKQYAMNAFAFPRRKVGVFTYKGGFVVPNENSVTLVERNETYTGHMGTVRAGSEFSGGFVTVGDDATLIVWSDTPQTLIEDHSEWSD